MRRPIPALAAASVALATPAGATIIDSFETGSFTCTLNDPGVQNFVQTPSPGHCIATQRTVVVRYLDGTGEMHSELVPLSGQDDALTTTFPTGDGLVTTRYDGGPWDLTGGGATGITVRITGGGPQSEIAVMLYRGTDNAGITRSVTQAGYYNFPLSDFPIDVTSIDRITFTMRGSTGETLGVRQIETTDPSFIGLNYRSYFPHNFTLLCPGAEAAAGGEEPSTLGWTWRIPWPSAPQLAGPVLEVVGVSGPGCAGVTFQGTNSSGGRFGQFGELGMAIVEWLGTTFDNAAFELRFTTDPAAPFGVEPLGSPQVTVYESAVVISQDVAISDVPDVPDGTIRQETILSVHPDQFAVFDYADVLPLGGGGVGGTGFSLSLGMTGIAFTPGSPLLEMFMLSSYADDAGATGVPAPAAAGGGSLAAHPSVTRGGTRFVLPAGTRDGTPLDVYDVAGRRVRGLAAAAGAAEWNGTSADGARVPAGVYFGRVPGVPGSARVVVLR